MELEKFRLNFSRCTNRDGAPLRKTSVMAQSKATEHKV